MEIPLPPSPPPSKPLEYSPSHVTSSHSEDDEPPPLPEPQKPKEIPLPKINMKIKNNSKVLASLKVKNMLKSYVMSKNVNKVNKKGSAVFGNEEEEEKTVDKKEKSIEPDKKPVDTPPKVKKPEKESSNKAAAGPPKLNIVSAMEEKIKPKVEEVAPKIVLDMMPNMAGSALQRSKSAAGPVEEDLIHEKKAQEAAEKLAKANMAMKNQQENAKVELGSFGFVISKNRVETGEVKEAKRERDRSVRKRARQRSRSSEKKRGPTDEQLKEKYGLKEMPGNWKKLKSAKFDAVKYSSDLSRLKKIFGVVPDSSADDGLPKIVMGKVVKDEDVKCPTLIECTNAFEGSSKVTLSKLHHHARQREFPAAGMRKTSGKDPVEWCFNPTYCSGDAYKKRADYPGIDETIKSLAGDDQSPPNEPDAKVDDDDDDETDEQEWYARTSDFLSLQKPAAFERKPKEKKAKKKAKKKSKRASADEAPADHPPPEGEEAAESGPAKKPKKAKKAKKAKKREKRENSPKAAEGRQAAEQPLLSSKLMSIAGYGSEPDSSPKPAKERGGEDPRSPSPAEQPPGGGTRQPASQKRQRSDEKQQPPQAQPAQAVSPPTDPRLRAKPAAQPAGPRTPSPGVKARTGPRTPSPRLRSPGSPRYRPESPHSPRFQGRRSPGSPGRSGGRRLPRSPGGGFSPRRGGGRRSPLRGARSPSPYSRSLLRARSPSPRSRSGRRSGGRRSPGSPGSPRYGRSRYCIESSFRLERSVADSTISDADLLSRSRSMDLLHGSYYPSSSQNLDMLRGNSPKRLSIDERLEQELGIKVRDDLNAFPDMSRPPPGYGGPVNYGVSPHQINAGNQIAPPPVEIGSQIPTVTNFQARQDTPEEGRLVRVGNMLQIVPEKNLVASPKKSPAPASNSPQKTPASPLKTPASPQKKPAEKPVIVPPPEHQQSPLVNDLMRKIEEQKRLKEAERKRRRDQRMAEQLNNSSSRAAEEAVEARQTDSSRILEAIEREEEEDKEARILAEAISSVPEDDHACEEDEDGEYAAEGCEEEDVQGFSAEKRARMRRERGADSVRYISLKPLTKKERRRQQKMAAQIEAMDSSVDNVDNNEGSDEAEELVKRSPVPLPDASTVKPILNQLGSLRQSAKSKKVLRYADGVLPGQGSPDHNSFMTDSPPPPPPRKKRKKLKIQIIYTRNPDDSSDSDMEDVVPPPPPPGKPKLYHTAEFISKFAYKCGDHLQKLVAATS